MKITTNLLKECGAFEELTQWGYQSDDPVCQCPEIEEGN